MPLSSRISRFRPCEEASAWLDSQPSPEVAWASCDRGDWMLWLLGQLSWQPEDNGRKALVLCACECARTALPYAKSPTTLACIETAERWARGEAAFRDLVSARKAATYTFYANAADGHAANSAIYATYYNTHSSYAAASAADAAAASAAAYDNTHSSYAAARSNALNDCADIVRRHYPYCPDPNQEKE